MSDQTAALTPLPVKARLGGLMFLQYFVQGSYLPIAAVYLRQGLQLVVDLGAGFRCDIEQGQRGQLRRQVLLLLQAQGLFRLVELQVPFQLGIAQNGQHVSRADALAIETASAGEDARSLPPSREKAYRLFCWAVAREPALANATDVQVFRWLQRDERVDRDEFTGSCATFCRYLREARSFHGKRKNSPRAGRPATDRRESS